MSVEIEEEVQEEVTEPENDEELENQNDDQEGEDDELTVSFGDDSDSSSEDGDDDGEPDTGLVKHLRKVAKDAQREAREIKRRLEDIEKQSAVEKEVALPPEPTLEDADYDADEFKKRLREYDALVAEHNKKQSEKQAQQQQEVEQWNGKLQKRQEETKRYKSGRWEEAQATISSVLDETRRNIIIDMIDDSTSFEIALSENEKLLDEVAKEKNLGRFIKKIVLLEQKLQVGKDMKRKPPSPEGKVSGSGNKSAIDSTLDKLRAEAEKTGDYSKVTAYKRKKKSA